MSKSEFNIIFQEILKKVGDDGRFQRRFNILFNFVFIVLICLPNMNLYIIMLVPQHWCHVPGREQTNFSSEEWKNLTIPRTKQVEDSSLSSCKMFNTTFGNLSEQYLQDEVTDCQNGWEYDQTYYRSTITTDENWVCHKELTVTNTFVASRVGDIVGNFIFSQLGDMFGRIFSYYLSIFVLLVGRISTIFLSPYVGFFLFSIFFGSLASTAAFQTPMVMAIEITTDKNHAAIAMLQCVAWSLGSCLLPMIMWLLGDWVAFLLATTLPCGIFLFARRFIVESPKWLASKGKKERCFKELTRIANTNGTKVDSDLALLIHDACTKKEVSYGVVSIFRHWRLIKNMLLLVYGTIIVNIVYYVLTLNITNMSGNPLLNFLYQGFAELPGYITGKVLCNRIGRRLTNILGATGMALGTFLLIFIINDTAYVIYFQICVFAIKLCLSLCFYSVNLMALEIFPTPVRQSGCALGSITANIFGAISPYIVYLGTSQNATYPYIICAVLCAIGILLGLCLPETLHQQLPETLAQAYDFGKDQLFWHIPKKLGREVAFKYDVVEIN